VDGHVDEALPQIVVGVPLDAPGHGLGGTGESASGGPNHQ
jgi:hypothetical protein